MALVLHCCGLLPSGLGSTHRATTTRPLHHSTIGLAAQQGTSPSQQKNLCHFLFDNTTPALPCRHFLLVSWGLTMGHIDICAPHRLGSYLQILGSTTLRAIILILPPTFPCPLYSPTVPPCATITFSQLCDGSKHIVHAALTALSAAYRVRCGSASRGLARISGAFVQRWLPHPPPQQARPLQLRSHLSPTCLPR